MIAAARNNCCWTTWTDGRDEHGRPLWCGSAKTYCGRLLGEIWGLRTRFQVELWLRAVVEERAQGAI